MGQGYGALRLWSTVLIVVGVSDFAEYVQGQRSRVK
jgi:hypothetical protein